MTAQTTYKRGQVEWALWRYFTATQGGSRVPPRPFKTRIKRLLELDRKMEKDPASETTQARYAFHNEPPPGHGVEVQYTAYNAFLLAIGLDMLEAGFKQAEVVFMLRHTMQSLKDQHADIIASPPAFRQRLRPVDRPGCSTYTRDGFEWADCRVFMLVSQSEFLELYPTLEPGWPKGRPLFLEPRFCKGVDELRDALHGLMPYRRHKLFVQELSLAATVVGSCLEAAPVVKRGRASG